MRAAKRIGTLLTRMLVRLQQFRKMLTKSWQGLLRVRTRIREAADELLRQLSVETPEFAHGQDALLPSPEGRARTQSSLLPGRVRSRHTRRDKRLVQIDTSEVYGAETIQHVKHPCSIHGIYPEDCHNTNIIKTSPKHSSSMAKIYQGTSPTHSRHITNTSGFKSADTVGV